MTTSETDVDCADLPLCDDDDVQDDVTGNGERRDDVAVLSSEGGISAEKSLHGKRSLYQMRSRLRCKKCHLKQGTVLALGMSLTLVALTLVVVGAVRSRQHSAISVIHPPFPMQVKHPANIKAVVNIGEENLTIVQLLYLSNLALDKPAHQTSVPKGSRTPLQTTDTAGLAVDGNLSSCSVSGLEKAPIWYVDLLKPRTIRSVRIQGRNRNQLGDLAVYVSNLSNTTSAAEVCGKLNRSSSRMDVRIRCQGQRTGRYVVIELQAKKDTYKRLVLCEVMVFR